MVVLHMQFECSVVLQCSAAQVTRDGHAAVRVAHVPPTVLTVGEGFVAQLAQVAAVRPLLSTVNILRQYAAGNA